MFLSCPPGNERLATALLQIGRPINVHILDRFFIFLLDFKLVYNVHILMDYENTL